MNRLHEQGYISDPRSKTKSVVLAVEGLLAHASYWSSCLAARPNKAMQLTVASFDQSLMDDLLRPAQPDAAGYRIRRDRRRASAGRSTCKLQPGAMLQIGQQYDLCDWGGGDGDHCGGSSAPPHCPRLMSWTLRNFTRSACWPSPLASPPTSRRAVRRRLPEADALKSRLCAAKVCYMKRDATRYGDADGADFLAKQRQHGRIWPATLARRCTASGCTTSLELPR